MAVLVVNKLLVLVVRHSVVCSSALVICLLVGIRFPRQILACVPTNSPILCCLVIRWVILTPCISIRGDDVLLLTPTFIVLVVIIVLIILVICARLLEQFVLTLMANGIWTICVTDLIADIRCLSGSAPLLRQLRV